MRIYHNPRCRKSRETLQVIQDAGIEPEIIEYLKDTPSAEELADLISKLGIKPYELLRKSEVDFKDLFKGKELPDAKWINIMVKYPKLIERPIVVKGDEALLGRPPENVKKFL